MRRERYDAAPSQGVFAALLEAVSDDDRHSVLAQTLASVLCYPAMLEDILVEGRPRAEGPAARYYMALGELDAGIDDCGGRVDHQTYEIWLREQYGRKCSF